MKNSLIQLVKNYIIETQLRTTLLNLRYSPTHATPTLLRPTQLRTINLQMTHVQGDHLEPDVFAISCTPFAMLFQVLSSHGSVDGRTRHMFAYMQIGESVLAVKRLFSHSFQP